jgi:hypothetical protein
VFSKIQFFYISVLFAAILGTATLPNGYLDHGAPVKIEVSILDMKTAQKLFDAFKSDPSIPFRYPVDGCYARATAMSKIAKAKGITMARINVEGDLQVQTDLPKYRKVQWGWHVAVVALVKDASGKTVSMVFDPSLFDKPVTEQVWEQRLIVKTDDFDPKIKQIYYGSQNQYWMRTTEGVPTEFHEYYRSKPPTDSELGDYAVKVLFVKYSPLQDSPAARNASPESSGAK